MRRLAMFFARLRGWFFRHRKLRSNSYRPRCQRCYKSRLHPHRPCFEPGCYCQCSRFHGFRKPDASANWQGLLTKAETSNK